MVRRVILDAEFNGLNPDRLWCVSLLDCDSGDISTFRFDGRHFVTKVKMALREYDQYIGHNILNFDGPILRRLLASPKLLADSKLVDTLVLSRLINAGRKRHSVEALGEEIGCKVKKVKVGNDEWNDPSKIDLYAERCEADVRIQYEIWKTMERFVNDPEWQRAIEIEHYIELMCEKMHKNGFGFDYEKAQHYLSEIEGWMGEIEKEIVDAAPPRLVIDTPIILKEKKDGTPTVHTASAVDCSEYHFVPGVSFHRFHHEPFNPRSADQRIKFLNECGWKPYEKTKGHIKQERTVRAIGWKLRHLRGQAYKDKLTELEGEKVKLEKFKELGWKVSEGNLDTLPPDAPRAASLMAQWLSLEGRRGDLVEWMAAYIPDSGRIHGRFNGIGAWTHRMSHYAPNQGNIFSSFNIGDIRGDSPSPVELVKLKYNNALRATWVAKKDGSSEGAWLTGTDASGIQLRILAHYINDEDYSHAVCFGRKEDGTDIHSVNRDLLGEVCSGRDNAKTFIYAWVLGAGDEEVSRILQCDRKRAQEAVDGFIGRVGGLRRLKRVDIPAVWKARYFVGLDGRKVIVPSEHHVLAGYLQNGEAVIMKHATKLWSSKLDDRGIDYKLVDSVHDEWQTESYDEEVAHEIGRLQVESIVETGEMLNLNVPLAGEYQVGKNWYETH